MQYLKQVYLEYRSSLKLHWAIDDTYWPMNLITKHVGDQGFRPETPDL
jgi:hypothetical protein